MKRDIETIRDILPRLDQYNNKPIEDKLIEYHLRMMLNGNIITGKTTVADNTTFFNDLELTNEGYDILTSITNDDIWSEVKETLHKNGFTVNDVPLAVVRELANKAIISRLEL